MLGDLPSYFQSETGPSGLKHPLVEDCCANKLQNPCSYTFKAVIYTSFVNHYQERTSFLTFSFKPLLGIESKTFAHDKQVFTTDEQHSKVHASTCFETKPKLSKLHLNLQSSFHSTCDNRCPVLTFTHLFFLLCPERLTVLLITLAFYNRRMLSILLSLTA